MTRHMYDATSSNAGVLAQLNLKDPNLVAIYLTGSPDIRWTPAQVALFPNIKTFVRIDQGGPTSPQYQANVFDAEPNAWSIPRAIAATAVCTAPRPTVYCDRNDYATIPGSYTGDIWLAAPGISDAEAIALAATDKRIVAVQNLWANSYDRSIVVDPYWPERKPVTPPPPPPTLFEYQVQWYKAGFGWVGEGTVTTADPAVKFRARGRSVDTKGAWSDWVEFAD